jgi:hypothetical protein
MDKVELRGGESAGRIRRRAVANVKAFSIANSGKPALVQLDRQDSVWTSHDSSRRSCCRTKYSAQEGYLRAASISLAVTPR